MIAAAPGWDALTPAQAAAARPFVDARLAQRRHLVVYLSGAHAYGFPSPDSDLDIKCVHVAPTGSLLGLSGAAPAGVATIEQVDGVELDYGSNELAAALRGALKGDGNYLERLLGRLVLVEDPALAALRPLLRAALSARVYHHYRGFASSQRHGLVQSPTAKKVLYVLRTSLTGAHLLGTGELETDLTRLVQHYPVDGVDELVATKRRGEKVVLAADVLARWTAELDRVKALLDDRHAHSVLPPSAPPDAVAALDGWLVGLRRGAW
jgi:predicted nucleotidyltransferase